MFQFTSARNASCFKFMCVRGLFIALAFVCLLSMFVSSGIMQSKSVDGGTTANLITWTNFQPASRVLGQTNFTTATSGVGNNKFNLPIGVAVDPTSGKVFVSEFTNSRVLRFSSLQAATSGGAAEAVLGQPDFVTTILGTSQNQMFNPQGIFVDSAGRLWVTDANNHRVLRFDGASAKANGANADGVLGQPNFTTATEATTQNAMRFPTGVFAEGGRLWVADLLNHRVTRFDNAAGKPNGANADGVLGQPNFITNTAATTQNKMTNPIGVVVDSAGRLWVADRSNNRVTRFDNAAAKADGALADAVLGQPDFITNTALATQSGMNNPRGVTVDLAGRLYVGDQINNRILIFNNAAALGNGANASNVLGQPDFTTGTANNGGISASSLNSPFYIFFNETSQNLFAADGNNQRVLRFGAPPTAAGVTISGRVSTANGAGLRNAVVTLTDSAGNSRTARTSSFGYYSFEEVEAGQTYIVAVASKRFTFAPQVVSVGDNITDLDFTAQ